MLNAFRHQRFNTIEPKESVFPYSPCSTPFGIRDSTHLSLSTSICSFCRAQRLSASEIQHREFSLFCHPYSYVLNAFRHQRFNTASSCEFDYELSSAQRLSASEIQHKMTDSITSIVLRCSTPFGIRDSTLLLA